MEIRMMINNQWMRFNPKPDITPEEVARLLQMMVVVTNQLVAGDKKFNWLMTHGLIRHFDPEVEATPTDNSEPPAPEASKKHRCANTTCGAFFGSDCQGRGTSCPKGRVRQPEPQAPKGETKSPIREMLRRLGARAILVCVLPVAIWSGSDRKAWASRFKHGGL